MIRGALGTEYSDYYIACKQEEWRQYHQSVSPWEIEHYLLTY